MKKENLELYLKQIQEDWPSPFVARCKIGEFTKGMYKAVSMNTFDASNKGINERYKLRKTVFYKVEDVVNWIRSKIRSA